MFKEVEFPESYSAVRLESWDRTLGERQWSTTPLLRGLR